MAAAEPVLVALYVPGDRPERFAKAFAAGADQVIVDLEDAVVPGRKELARHAVAELLAGAPPGRVAVRPNGAGTPWHEADLAVLTEARVRPALRLPKVEGPDDVDRVLELLGDAGGSPWELTCLLESALGVEQAYVVARHPAVSGIALGEADLRAELGVTAEAALDWLRVRSVVAARAAGLPAPAMAVFPRLGDDDALRASCRHGAALGLRGRAAIHPRQVPVIREAFTPTADEVADARSVLDALAGAAGAVRLPDGRMVDAAMAAEARAVVALAPAAARPPA